MKHSVFFLILCVLACERQQSSSPAVLRPDPHESVTRWIQTVAARDYAAWESPGIARVDGEGSGEVTSSVRVRVVRVLVQAGDRVSAGSAVVEVEVPDVMRALGRRSGAVGRVAPLRRWRAELEAQRSAGMVRSSEVRDVEARVAEAEADLRNAEADVRAAALSAADLSSIERTGRCALRSPVSGIVRAIHATPGHVVEPGHDPIAEIVSDRPARIEVRVMQPWPRGATLRFVTPMGAELALDPTPVSEVTDPATGGRVAWFRVANNTALAAGATGRVVVSGVQGNGVEVPSRALVREGESAWVLQREGTQGRRVRVEVLAVSQNRAVITGIGVGIEIAAEQDPGTGEH
jgi:biotin carboxyl carrier protein